MKSIYPIRRHCLQLVQLFVLMIACITPAVAFSATKQPVTKPATEEVAPDLLRSPPGLDSRPVNFRMTARRALRVANRLPKVKKELVKYQHIKRNAFLKGQDSWQVSYFAGKHGEVAQVLISDRSGRVLQTWTGFQVAWPMARGYPGAFGRIINSWYIWLGLSLLFILPFINPRRPLQLLHLDLLALLSFSLSLGFFNHAKIAVSVPLVYPPLLYLLFRMLAIGWLSGRQHPKAGETGKVVVVESPDSALTSRLESKFEQHSSRRNAGCQLLVPPRWLLVGLVFLVVFRITLNLTNSNVIDVGYAGVIGAERVLDNKSLYGKYPKDNPTGDTYGPVNYLAYVPFAWLLHWSGSWDDLPAAHGAAIAFDLLVILLLFLLGRRIRGPNFGIVLAYAWAAFPFTALVLNSNANDALVAALVLAALLALNSPLMRGGAIALAGFTKFAPFALVPLYATYRARKRRYSRRVTAVTASGAHPRVLERTQTARLAKSMLLFKLGLLLVVAIMLVPVLLHTSLTTFAEHTIEFQRTRPSPFSIWGMYGLHTLQVVAQCVVIVLVFVVAVIPVPRNHVTVTAYSAAVLIALELVITHWFYLYIVWFFPLVMIALLSFKVTSPLISRP